jgi:hypothetical protein
MKTPIAYPSVLSYSRDMMTIGATAIVKEKRMARPMKFAGNFQ